MTSNAPFNDSLNSPLSQFLDENREIILLQILWRQNACQNDLGRYQTYFTYYHDEMRRLQFSMVRESQLLSRTAAQTHADVVKVIMTLSEHRHLPLTQLRVRVQSLFPTRNEDAVQNSIDLALRVWLTLNVRHESTLFHNLQTGTPRIVWDNVERNLVDFVAHQFPLQNLTPIASTESKLDQGFTAAYLIRACSVRIDWTTCIADHLRYDEKERVLRIYEFRQCVFDHLRGSGTSLSTFAHGQPIYPIAVLNEIIWSLNQFFPADDKPTRHFLHQSSKTFNMDGPFDLHRPVDLNEYRYLREKLRELHQVYRAEPENFAQWYYKRQSYDKKLQVVGTIVLGFILATFFGAVASVTAIISARAAVQGLAIAKEGLEVAQQAYEMQKKTPICPCS